MGWEIETLKEHIEARLNTTEANLDKRITALEDSTPDPVTRRLMDEHERRLAMVERSVSNTKVQMAMLGGFLTLIVVSANLVTGFFS